MANCFCSARWRCSGSREERGAAAPEGVVEEELEDLLCAMAASNSWRRCHAGIHNKKGNKGEELEDDDEGEAFVAELFERACGDPTSDLVCARVLDVTLLACECVGVRRWGVEAWILAARSACFLRCWYTSNRASHSLVSFMAFTNTC
jgi:hypothetical protein